MKRDSAAHRSRLLSTRGRRRELQWMRTCWTPRQVTRGTLPLGDGASKEAGTSRREVPPPGAAVAAAAARCRCRCRCCPPPAGTPAGGGARAADRPPGPRRTPAGSTRRQRSDRAGSGGPAVVVTGGYGPWQRRLPPLPPPPTRPTRARGKGSGRGGEVGLPSGLPTAWMIPLPMGSSVPEQGGARKR